MVQYHRQPRIQKSARDYHSLLSPPPRLLVSLGDFSGDKLAIFSYPNPEGDASVPYRDLSLLRTDGAWVCGAVRGLICFRSVVVGKVGICNPSTRQVQLLPELRFNHRIPGFYVHPHYFLGHDPVEDQYKMVAIDIVPWRLEHKIVVVGGGVDWKETPCAECPHSAQTRGICMNGFIYYGATRKDVDYPDNSSVLVCFDVRLEKFSIINVPVPGPGPVGCQGLWFGTHPTLINYRGKVGVVEDPKHGAFRMWVLEDAEKQEWPMVAFLLPKSAPGPDCLVPSELSVPFCLHYYNLERNSIRKVRIQGLPVRKLIKQANRFSISVSDHSESFMF